jgi:hypothetical protein
MTFLNRIALHLALFVTIAGNAVAAQAPSPATAAPAGDGWQLLSTETQSAGAPRLIDAPIDTPAKAVSNDEPDPIAAAAESGGKDSQVVPFTASTMRAQASTARVAQASASKAWTVTTSDGNFRELLTGWTLQEGWKLVWNVDQDVPIVGDDHFTGDLKFAARRALASTEMTDTPIKPCFYSNNVLRVVPFTTPCDPTQSAN